MKLNFKKALMLLCPILAGGSLLAQTPDSSQYKNYVKPFAPSGAFRTWSFGLEGEGFSDQTIFGFKSDYYGHQIKFGEGGFIKAQILPALGIRADILIGSLAGTDASFPTSSGVTYQKFDTKINWMLSGSLVYTFANINWRQHKSFMEPYFSIGGGAITYSPSYTTTTGQTGTLTRGSGSNFQEFYIPVGVGTKISVFPGVNIDLGYTVNFVNANNFYSLTTPSHNDKFANYHAGLEFLIGNRKKPVLATYNPVSSMYYDYTMQTTALKTQQQVLQDAMQAQAQKLQAELADQKAQNDRLAADLAKATTDSDGDGVSDLFDKCPGTAAGVKVDGTGCPLAKAENVKVYITEEDRKVVKDAIKNLEFDLGKSTIRAHSLPSLDKVAELLVNKNFSLKLAGHTDNIGSASLNMRLSKDRAESIKSYLVSKGANASRIEATGYGKSQPIASNKTAEGRQDNRRVEFTLY